MVFELKVWVWFGYLDRLLIFTVLSILYFSFRRTIRSITRTVSTSLSDARCQAIQFTCATICSHFYVDFHSMMFISVLNGIREACCCYSFFTVRFCFANTVWTDMRCVNKNFACPCHREKWLTLLLIYGCSGETTFVINRKRNKK